MCGITGFINHDTASHRCIDAMTDSLVHRGPDDRGTFQDRQLGLALGMRRLAVVDLEGGRQPMADADQQITLVFNGEIYNHVELRATLRGLGYEFVSDHSDTEVLLHGYRAWGAGLFVKLNGMFAIAIWDRSRQELTLARDRFGKKPLYVGRLADGGFAFGSELKALVACHHMHTTLDSVAAAQYLAYDFVLSPRSILQQVTKVRAGHIARLSGGRMTSMPFWAPNFQTQRTDQSSAVAELNRLLDAAVARRMVADVPVGLFLSGGLDSSTVGYYMCKHSEQVESFSIGFANALFDESKYASMAAKHLGTKHHVEMITDNQLLDLVAQLPTVLDEPMGDQSILPTLLLSQFARKHVTVALGGDGSDEILMGYKAFRALKLGWYLDHLPLSARGMIVNAASARPDAFRSLHPSAGRFLSRLSLPPTARLLAHLGSFDGDPRTVLRPEVANALAEFGPERDAEQLTAGYDSLKPHQAATLAYVRGYLLEDILVKVDRASMAASLEVRAPFLDPDVVDFAFNLPQRLKLRGLTGKYLLKELMRERIPAELVTRRKQGFGVPIAEWLRGPLNELLLDTLSKAALVDSELLEPASVEQLVTEHCHQGQDHGDKLWVLLQLELWRRHWLSNPSASSKTAVRKGLG